MNEKNRLLRFEVNDERFFQKVEDKFGIIWDEDGMQKIFTEPLDFIIRCSNKREDDLNLVIRLINLNPGLIKKVKVL